MRGPEKRTPHPVVFPIHLSPPAKAHVPSCVCGGRLEHSRRLGGLEHSTQVGGPPHPATDTPFPTPPPCTDVRPHYLPWLPSPPGVSKENESKKQTLWAGAARTDILSDGSPRVEETGLQQPKNEAEREGQRETAPPPISCKLGKCPSPLKAW